MQHSEFGLPDSLNEYIEKFKESQTRAATDKTYLSHDCVYCELQSEINVAEVEQMISPETAWYLREKYLGIVKEDISELLG